MKQTKKKKTFLASTTTLTKFEKKANENEVYMAKSRQAPVKQIETQQERERKRQKEHLSLSVFLSFSN